MLDEPDTLPDTSRKGRLTRGERVGGRSERVVREVLQAAIAELATVGYAAFRIEDVAEKAGVNKTTVYRRWPTKAELVSAAVRTVGFPADPMPDTGDLRKDIAELVERMIRFLNTHEGKGILRLITTERGDPAIEQLARSLKTETHARRLVIIDRAKARGDLPADLDGTLVMEAILAPIMTRVIRFEEKVDMQTVHAFVDLVVTGAEHGGGVRARGTSKRKR